MTTYATWTEPLRAKSPLPLGEVAVSAAGEGSPLIPALTQLQQNGPNNPLPALRGRPLPEGEVKQSDAVQLRILKNQTYGANTNSGEFIKAQSISSKRSRHAGVSLKVGVSPLLTASCVSTCSVFASG